MPCAVSVVIYAREMEEDGVTPGHKREIERERGNVSAGRILVSPAAGLPPPGGWLGLEPPHPLSRNVQVRV